MIGIVADDITGANDIGLMFAKHGYRVEVFSEYTDLDLSAIPADVVILNTNSRCDDFKLAYEKVAAATGRLLPLGCRLLMKKTCSVFRGNVGAEFDALLDAAGGDYALVVSAFPKNGRVTIHGQHFVHGRALADSEFARDPVHPMRLNDLRDIISEQSRRPSRLLDVETVVQGVAAVRRAVEEGRSKGGYLVADARHQEDLRVLAEAWAEEPFIFGSSAIGEELPRFWPAPEVGLAAVTLPPSAAGTLIISGSVTPQTRAQVARARQNGLPTGMVDTRLLFTSACRKDEIERLVGWAEPLLGAGQAVLVFGAHQPEDIADTYEVAARAGFGRVKASRMVSNTLGEIARRLVERVGVKRLVVAGGETSGHVCNQLGIIGNLVLEEIEAGLPSGLSRGRHELLLVLKSGSFGTADFLLKAVEHLERLGA